MWEQRLVDQIDAPLSPRGAMFNEGVSDNANVAHKEHPHKIIPSPSCAGKHLICNMFL
jgi:hypothetical protein